MTGSSKITDATRLRKAIEAYRAGPNRDLDRHSVSLLIRLENDADIAAAFKRLKLKDGDHASAILHSCVVMERAFRTFTQRVDEERLTLAKLERLERGVVGLLSFVKAQEERALFVDGYRAKLSENDNLMMIRCEKHEFEIMEQGLELITSLINGRRYIAETTPSVLGATRKKHEPRAAENASIWHLAQAVKRITGRAHFKEVADIAQIVLRIEISVDRVRSTQRRHPKP